jgi:hypothetical protein
MAGYHWFPFKDTPVLDQFDSNLAAVASTGEIIQALIGGFINSRFAGSN